MMMMKWISTIVCCVSIWSVVVVESRLGQQIMPPMGVMPNMMNNNMGGYGFGQGAQMNSNPMPMMAQNAAMSMMGGMGGMGMGGMGMGGMGMGGMAGQPQFMGPWTQMQNPLSNQIPGVGYNNNGQISVYPQHHPSIGAMHPHSPYNFGGYDTFGFPLPHPGVASSTPPPPEGGEAVKKA